MRRRSAGRTDRSACRWGNIASCGGARAERSGPVERRDIDPHPQGALDRGAARGGYCAGDVAGERRSGAADVRAVECRRRGGLAALLACQRGVDQRAVRGEATLSRPNHAFNDQAVAEFKPFGTSVRALDALVSATADRTRPVPRSRPFAAASGGAARHAGTTAESAQRAGPEAAAVAPVSPLEMPSTPNSGDGSSHNPYHRCGISLRRAAILSARCRASS